MRRMLTAAGLVSILAAGVLSSGCLITADQAKQVEQTVVTILTNAPPAHAIVTNVPAPVVVAPVVPASVTDPAFVADYSNEQAHAFTDARKIVVHAALGNFDGNSVQVNVKCPSYWPTDGYCPGDIELYVLRDGRWQGGRFEWQSNGNDAKILIPGNTGGAVDYPAAGIPQPRAGDQACFVIGQRADSPQTERSQALFVTWPAVEWAK